MVSQSFWRQSEGENMRREADVTNDDRQRENFGCERAELQPRTKATPICVIGNWPAIASDLEVDPCQRYDSEG
jgi:hypothetical protein